MKDILTTLINDFELHTFNSDFDLTYENQIPCVGIAVIEGSIFKVKAGKAIEEIPAGEIVGVNELLEEKPMKYGFRVKAGSKVILLGRSDLLKLKKNEAAHPLNKLIKTG